MNRVVGLITGLLAITASLSTTIEAQAQAVKSSGVITHTYSGVARCGEPQTNLAEADIAAKAYVNQLSTTVGKPVTLSSYSILMAPTRYWEERDRFGFSKGRKCETTMRINVEYQVYF
ncbi:hypothetical protein LC605_27240 [Nostoc sp. CHAB 5836]|uniref:hypothetical protein n=1 Tax=Nostoc sp. CHAB 5836 TaxID=2780404 RepID=UPI001E4BA448|nr:hypothetical protein [Nostoc sp. CHAB 5836]MCC5618717.1 hypothetical protein [Nostoc sp. CHAB 5836]